MNFNFSMFPYKMSSMGGRDLAKNLGIKRIKREGSVFRATNKDVIINWGSSMPPAHVMGAYAIINRPEAIGIASNKARSFRALTNGGVRIPANTTDRQVAKRMFNAGSDVYVRHLLQGNSGKGIEIISHEDNRKAEDIPEAPLYVEAIDFDDEYRIHVFNGEMLDKQEKRRTVRVPEEEANWKIRNHKNGFIFCRQDVNPPKDVIHQAILAVKAMGLDFGAADVIWCRTKRKAYVLEVNTAPGLTGTTLVNYTEAFKKYFKECYNAS